MDTARIWLGVWLAVSSVAVAVRGQEPAPVEAEDPAVVEARERFDRGVQFTEEGNYGPALAEFERAYELTSHWGVLYNLGLVSDMLGRPVEALGYFEEYLRGGGADLDAERVSEVNDRLASLRERVAEIRVTVDVAGAEVLVDGEVVGATPLVDPLRVESGPHTVTVRHPDHGTVRRDVMLAGGMAETVDLVLRSPVAPPPGGGGEDEGSIAEEWWFWTIIGAVVVGGGVTAGVLLAPSGTAWTEGSAGWVQLD